MSPFFLQPLAFLPMCHHFRGARTPPEHLADEFSLRANLATLKQLWLTEAGFYPLAETAIARPNDAGEREVAAAEWGFLPRWWKPSDKTAKRSAFQRKCFNARSEEVHEKPTYRDAFKRRRCLMPADEFFERGHYFRLADERPFSFAALWEEWQGPADVFGEAETVLSCTLLTTEANELVRSVGHPRMPVLLTCEADYARWLDPDVAERGPLDSLFTPYDPKKMTVRPA